MWTGGKLGVAVNGAEQIELVHGRPAQLQADSPDVAKGINMYGQQDRNVLERLLGDHLRGTGADFFSGLKHAPHRYPPRYVAASDNFMQRG